MRKLNGLILLSVMTLAYSMANAQMTIVIDGQQIPTAHIASIVILPNTSEINVATTVDYTVTAGSVVGTDVVINSFTGSPSTVLAGATVAFNWTTTNAVSCNASGGVDGWAGPITALPDGNKTITTATVGTHTFTLTCNGSATGDTTTRDFTVSVTPADAVSITSFTATPDAIAVNGATTLSWNTLNAESCTPTGGAGNWASQSITTPSGSAGVTIDAVGTYTFNLLCVGPSGDQQTRSDVVVVSPEALSCDSVTLGGNIVAWRTFWSANFPGPDYENVSNWQVGQKGYLALEFDTDNIIDNGKLTALENSSSPGIRIGSISTCPGDFNVADECKYKWGLGGGIKWATDGKFGACDLDPNTTYYFNITFTDGVDPDTTACNSTPCRVNLQHTNF